MPLFKSTLVTLGIASLALLALAGCDQPPPPDQAQPYYYQMSPSAPPMPMPEYVPLPSDPRVELWRPGYWQYVNGQFSWVAGEMMDRPNPTAIWIGDHWVEHSYGWSFEPGHWQ